MTRFDVYAALFQIPVDGQSQSRRTSGSAHSGPGNTQKSFARDFLQADGGSSGKGMILGQIDLERFLTKKEILQPGTSVLLTKKSDINQPLGKCRGQLRRVLGGDYHVNLWQLIMQNIHCLGNPR